MPADVRPFGHQTHSRPGADSVGRASSRRFAASIRKDGGLRVLGIGPRGRRTRTAGWRRGNAGTLHLLLASEAPSRGGSGGVIRSALSAAALIHNRRSRTRNGVWLTVAGDKVLRVVLTVACGRRRVRRCAVLRGGGMRAGAGAELLVIRWARRATAGSGVQGRLPSRHRPSNSASGGNVARRCAAHQLAGGAGRRWQRRGTGRAVGAGCRWLH